MNITNDFNPITPPKFYTEQEVLEMLEKLKYDAIYCNGDGIRFINVEDYLKK